jgi:hypothetical protein
MLATESIELKGQLRLSLTDRDGNTVLTQTAHNKVVTSGRDLVAKLFSNVENTATVGFVAVGTGDKEVSESDAALATQLGDRKALGNFDVNKDLSTVGSGDNARRKITRTVELDFAEANGELREAGLFTAATGGVMYNRVVFPTVTKTSSFKLTLVWEIQF